MGSLLAVAAGMRIFGLLITLLAAAPQAAAAQQVTVLEGTVIASVEVTGFDIDRLSPGLREEIRNLAGTPLERQRLDELAVRIEAERPRYVAAVRTVMEPDGRARVFFVMGRQATPDRDDNVNERYVVEHAEIVGLPDEELTQSLRDGLQAVVGHRLDSTEAKGLEERLKTELPRYDVSRRIQRGSEEGRIRLVYEARRKEPPPWLRFEPLRSNVLFHSDQGWGSYLDLPIGNGPVRFTPIVAIENGDDLVEEYSGFGLRFETRKLGPRWLGASLEWTQFDPDWQAATLDRLALAPGIPAAYDTRSTITPMVKLAVGPDINVAAGVSISELDPFFPETGSRMANAAVASLNYERRWRQGLEPTHFVEAGFGVRAGTRALESDLSYTRYLGQGTYRYDFGRHHLQATGMAGTITGSAPLFERFTLGDSRTLRGWDKYDIAPAGGNRLVYSSVEYRYTGVALFLDVGSVWDANSESRVHVSTGLGFHAGPAFLVVGFPLNTDDLRPVVALGLRIPGVGIRW